MLYFLLICSILAAAIFSTMNSVFSNKAIKSNRDFYLYNLIVSAAATILFLVLSKGLKGISVYSLLLGILFAAVMVLMQFSTTKSFRHGPMSYTTMVNSCGMIIPALAGVFFWSEKFSLFQLIGMIIVVISFVVGANFKKHSNITLQWMKYVSLLFLSAGAVGIVQKIHQSSVHKAEKFSFLCVTFFLMCIFSLIMYLVSGKSATDLKISFKSVSFCAAIGLLTAFNHAANLYLSGKLDSMFFFPVFNGSLTVVCFVISMILLKEKLNLTQKLSFVFGIVGVVFLSLGG